MVWFLFSSNFKTITNQWRFRKINLRLINCEVKTYSFLYSISRFGQVTHSNRHVKLTVPVIKAVGLSEDKNSFPQTALMRGCVENISCVSKREFFRHLKNKQRWTSSQNFAEVNHRPRVVITQEKRWKNVYILKVWELYANISQVTKFLTRFWRFFES